MPIISRTKAQPDDPIFTERATIAVTHKNPNRFGSGQKSNQSTQNTQDKEAGSSQTLSVKKKEN